MSRFCIKIAGKTAQIDSLFDSTRDYCRSYLADPPADFAVAATPEELVLEQQLLLEEALLEGFRPKQFPDPFLERSVLLRKLSEQLLAYDTVLLHGSAIAVNGQGYLFSAKSGTGKSTHVRFWQQLLGKDAVIINDDKPFFRITQRQVLVCGSPWNGKHGLDTNITVPLKGICFLQRGSENRIWRLNAQEAQTLLHANGCPPLDPEKQSRYLSLLDAMAERTALWGMKCTKDPQSAQVTYDAMSSQNNEHFLKGRVAMRNIININENWKFIRENAGLPAAYPAGWETVDLPHTWNAVDGNDGNGSYYRGKCWYAKTFPTPQQPLAGGRVFVEFMGANSEATVYINGEKVTYHEGGYSTFRADITDLCKDGEENLLVVSCSNEANDYVYPQNADFTFYGGLYRDVNLISVPNAHFDLGYYGGPGIMVTPKPTECGGATFEIEAFVKNADENFTVQYVIFDEEGKEVGYAVRPADAAKTTIFVPNAIAWDFENPYLYTVVAQLQRRNETYDEVDTRVGVRTFHCDPQKGFFLNGVLTPLRGVSRHQDMMYIGNALTADDHYDDACIIKELGANTIRLAHYQHSQDFYDACDELGFAIWAEIPFISVMSKNPAAHQNCIEQMKELIVQNYNHPSIMFWGVSNEILIGGISEQLVANHKELNALCKEMDPTRLTTIAHVSFTPVDGPMHYITDTESYNHYFGWYGGKMEDNGPWLDNFHAKHPNIPLGVSEYGCEGIITYHGPDPKCKDYSEDYQALYHEHMAKVLDERPWIWSSHVWNMFDFGCAARDEGGVAGRNNKGLVTMDRLTKKDSYYIYKAYWNPEPMVHLCGKRYAQRAGETREIKVYTNQETVSLYLNGAPVGEQQAVDHICRFEVALAEGQNIFLAVANGVKDTMTIEKVEAEPEIYTLPQTDDGNEGAANWFTAMGSAELEDNSPMEFPEGKMSVKTTLADIHKNPEAWEFLSKMTGGKIGPDQPMWAMMQNFNMETLMTMMGNAPESAIKALNKQLNAFDLMD